MLWKQKKIVKVKLPKQVPISIKLMYSYFSDVLYYWVYKLLMYTDIETAVYQYKPNFKEYKIKFSLVSLVKFFTKE